MSCIKHIDYLVKFIVFNSHLFVLYIIYNVKCSERSTIGIDFFKFLTIVLPFASENAESLRHLLLHGTDRDAKFLGNVGITFVVEEAALDDGAHVDGHAVQHLGHKLLEAFVLVLVVVGLSKVNAIKHLAEVGVSLLGLFLPDVVDASVVYHTVEIRQELRCRNLVALVPYQHKRIVDDVTAQLVVLYHLQCIIVKTGVVVSIESLKVCRVVHLVFLS